MINTVIDRINEYKKAGKNVFIYGAGTYGKNVCKLLKDNGTIVDGFVVTSLGNQEQKCLDLSIREVSSLNIQTSAFILAMNETNTTAVMKILSERGVSEDSIFDARPLIEHGGLKRGTRSGSIEVTTNMGCSVNCKYCPQKLLLSRYYASDKNKPSQMTMETFEKILSFFPDSYDISFGGMSEPFLNKRAMDMLKLACEKNRYVAIYTTLVGITVDMAYELIKLPVDWVTVHVADKLGYAHIPLTDDYYKVLEIFINAKKNEGNPFVNMCNAQTTPDERAAEICKGKYEIFTEMTDRAGNLEESDLIQNIISEGKVICGNSKDNELNSNIVLPDGSVVLCCMDYGLQHVLGNINIDTFEEIRNGKMMKYVKEGMNGDLCKDILCRNCSMAHKLN